MDIVLLVIRSYNQDKRLANYAWSNHNHPLGILMFHLIILNFLEIILWCLICKTLIRKTNALVWLCNIKKKMAVIMNIKRVTRRRWQTLAGT